MRQVNIWRNTGDKRKPIKLEFGAPPSKKEIDRFFTPRMVPSNKQRPLLVASATVDLTKIATPLPEQQKELLL